jgi:vitamin K-dependent gamma-carboxylase
MAIDFPKRILLETTERFVTPPIDIASLAAFRFLFGLMMATAMIRFLAKGWVTQFYVAPKYYFSYPGFGWVHPWPDPWMHVHFILLAVFALGIAAGFCYRICAALFFLGFTYVELIDQTNYLNHYYLISLLSGLIIFLPAHRAWSVDAWRKPAIRLDAVPAWTLNLLRFQVGIVYFFAGLAKINADWLFKAKPLSIWLGTCSGLPIIGPLLAQHWVAFAASWFGAIFDLSIVFFLLARRTRPIAYLFVIFFHAMTWLMFNIGIFPWVMLVDATVFFAPNWPRHFLERLNRAFAGRFPKLRFAEQIPSNAVPATPCPVSLPRPHPALLLVLGIYAAVQLALPLRSFFFAKPPAWTGTGFNCAWRVMIVEKTGYVEFTAFDPASGRRWKIPIDDFLTVRQQVYMAQDPDLVRAMARHLAAGLKAQGFRDIQIHADAFATLNGRPSQRMIDPEVDLASSVPSGWILSMAN